ncbi:P-loop containing nucleoside triphosphate hydrolase protein [Aspergillus ambiguus]|uniref:putative RAS small monomeric GTPase n=1 Tax=Aspergillus ambiguus TaxID=176160 RepID=UPI003CCDD2F1
MTDPDKISVTICGDGGCGKSSITLRLVRSEWIHEYDPTIEDSYSVTRTIDGIPYFLSITDTAGQEEYRGLWTAANLKSDAFLLVYDITNAGSLAALDYFMELIAIEADQRAEDNERLRQTLGASAEGVDVGRPPPVTIIAGNKCDLKEGRAVSARDGLEYARTHGCGFMETSAREMVNIEETFALLVRRVVEGRRAHYGGWSRAERGGGGGGGGGSEGSAGKGGIVIGRRERGSGRGKEPGKRKSGRWKGMGCLPMCRSGRAEEK